MSLCVSNASPLIALAKLQYFPLLKAIFNKIVVPDSVWREVILEGKGKPGADEVEAAQAAGWLSIHSVNDTFAVALLQAHLGDGESEAIILAQELNAQWVLLDDDLARATAMNAGLKVKGTVGVLIAGYHAGLIPDLKAVLDDLRAIGFWISDKVYSRALGNT